MLWLCGYVAGVTDMVRFRTPLNTVLLAVMTTEFSQMA